MADIKFGLGSLGHPTPIWIKNIFKTVLYMSGLWALLQPQLTDFGPLTRAAIDHWLLIGVTGLRFTITFFRYDYDETQP